MTLEMHPAKALLGECTVPGDKSISHRAALLASLADGVSQLENFLDSGVTRVMLRALTSLGVRWTLEKHVLTVHGNGPDMLCSPQEGIDCSHSATTMRLLAGALAGANVACKLDGSNSLRRRPMARIVDPLRMMGVPIHSSMAGTAPIWIQRREGNNPLHGISHSLSVASAQVKSALLLAGLGAEGITNLVEPGPSRDHTERMLATMGVKIACDRGTHRIVMNPPGDSLQPLTFRLPGDFSSAAFLICAGLIVPGSDLLIREVGLNPTRTGLLDALQEMGAGIEILPKPGEGGEPVGDIRVRSSDLSAIQVEGSLVVRMIDEFPIFAVVAAMADGETVVRGAGELRNKESDRINSLQRELSVIGIQIHELPDGFRILGRRPVRGGVQVRSHGDHRLAMALCVAGLMGDEAIVVEDAEIISQSFPGFVDQLRGLGVEVIG